MSSSAGSSVVVVAVIQATPVYFDLEKSLARALDLIAEAARRRAQLVVFPAAWLPGYPAWLDVCRDVSVAGYAPMKRVYAQMQENSILVPGRVTEVLAAAARRHQLTLVMGVQERVGAGLGQGTLYNTVLTFGPGGELLNRHRQLSPTHNEKLIWSPGDGEGMRAVATSIGQLGVSIGSEHWMPLVRQTLHLGGEEVHVALWPAVGELNQIASRHYAMEGRCFVIAAGGIMRIQDLPRDLELAAKFAAKPPEFLLDGGSAVIGPDGQYVAGPTFGAEVILLARINLERIREETLELGAPGHNIRPDLFEFQVRDNAARAAVIGRISEEPRAEPDHGREIAERYHQEVLMPSGTDGAALRIIPSARVINFEEIEP
ncbi:MAG: carbon-nitrogen hydrolase family protein [Acidobacteriota bacterium]